MSGQIVLPPRVPLRIAPAESFFLFLGTFFWNLFLGIFSHWSASEDSNPSPSLCYSLQSEF